MPIFNSSRRYGAVTQSFHWATVALVAVAWLLGIFGDDLPGKPAQAAGLLVHMGTGLLIGLLTVMRLSWRGIDPPLTETASSTGVAHWLHLASRLTHLGLYGLLIAVPLLGIGVQFARGNSLPIFGLFQIVSPWVADRAFARTIKEIHEWLAHALVVIALLHAAAALLHHRVAGDRTLLRMLPGK